MPHLTDKQVLLLIFSVAIFIFGSLLHIAFEFLFGVNSSPVQTGMICLVSLWLAVLLSWAYTKTP